MIFSQFASVASLCFGYIQLAFLSAARILLSLYILFGVGVNNSVMLPAGSQMVLKQWRHRGGEASGSAFILRRRKQFVLDPQRPGRADGSFAFHVPILDLGFTAIAFFDGLSNTPAQLQT